MDAEERIQAAAKFLLQSPPGEINDVLNDVRNIISDDESLTPGVLPALREYNLAQFTTTQVPGHQHSCIISEAALLPHVAKPKAEPKPKAPSPKPAAEEPSEDIAAEVTAESEDIHVDAAEEHGEHENGEEKPAEEEDVAPAVEDDAEATAEHEHEAEAAPAHESMEETEPEPEAEVEPEPEEEVDEGERFWDPRSRTSFRFDHMTMEASDPQHVEPTDENETFRAALETSALTYLTAHFHDGVVSVFPTKDQPEAFVLQIVANKYNPSNFWSGRWRSEYHVDLASRKLQGKILVNVHYYEQGNVQLATTHSVSLDLPSAITSANTNGSSSKILALIESEESRYQASLNESYQEMGDRTFKSLRRALPMTRAKLDWDKVLGYKLGAELSANKGGFS